MDLLASDEQHLDSLIYMSKYRILTDNEQRAMERLIYILEEIETKPNF